MNEQPKINRGSSDFTPTIDCEDAFHGEKTFGKVDLIR